MHEKGPLALRVSALPRSLVKFCKAGLHDKIEHAATENHNLHVAHPHTIYPKGLSFLRVCSWIARELVTESEAPLSGIAVAFSTPAKFQRNAPEQTGMKDPLHSKAPLPFKRRDPSHNAGSLVRNCIRIVDILTEQHTRRTDFQNSVGRANAAHISYNSIPAEQCCRGTRATLRTNKTDFSELDK